MLLFICTYEPSFDRLLTSGLTSEGEPYRLYAALETAEAACRHPGRATEAGRIVVLDPTRIDLATEDPPTTARVPPEAALNLDPYRPPRPVAAGGGLVLRRTDRGPEVLLIFRRGTWDLPKGKQDPGESDRETAEREVCEELGIDAVTMHGKLGTTLHGYDWPRYDAYAVKTTHWYAMTTTATAFEPEAEEDIEAVAWAPWDEAADRLGFDTLRDFVRGIDPDALPV